ncbi:MAG: CDP-alcohol phosphatidyltransferase family protein [Desulfobacterales bacterium]|jgi:CDP-diacylglycerol--glycerol-3-phosphate 3-phosphatidyltransferase|nr:CDP-alcohol phosphatidyltransferase family protein [Desulfobacterales bacterium]
MSSAISHDEALAQLRRRWRRAWIAALPFLCGGLWLWHTLWGAGAAAQAGLQTAAVMVYLWIRTDHMLALNRPPGKPRLNPRLGAANAVTLVRAALIAVLAGFLFRPAIDPAGPAAWAAWLPAALYLAASGLDAVDGGLARAAGGPTRLGARLDGEVDAIGLLAAASLAVWLGRAPAAFLAAGFGVYVVQAAAGLRRRLGRPVAAVQPRAAARLTAGCAMGFTAAILMPVFAAPAVAPAALTIAAALTAGFALDWLVVCGRAAPEGRLLDRRAARVQQAAARWLPLALRAGAAAGAGVLLATRGGGDPVHPLSGIEQGVLAGAAVMAALGIAARLAAVALSLTAAGMAAGPAAGAAWLLTAVCAAGLILTGAGRPRLWQPEEPFFRNRMRSRPQPPPARCDRP